MLQLFMSINIVIWKPTPFFHDGMQLVKGYGFIIIFFQVCHRGMKGCYFSRRFWSAMFDLFEWATALYGAGYASTITEVAVAVTMVEGLFGWQIMNGL